MLLYLPEISRFLHDSAGQVLCFPFVTVCHVNLICFIIIINYLHNILTIKNIGILNISNSWLSRKVTDFLLLLIHGMSELDLSAAMGSRKHRVALYIKNRYFIAM